MEKLKNKLDIDFTLVVPNIIFFINWTLITAYMLHHSLKNWLRLKREREVVLTTVFEKLAQRYDVEENKDESYIETNFESISWDNRWKEPHHMTGTFKCSCKTRGLVIFKK